LRIDIRPPTKQRSEKGNLVSGGKNWWWVNRCVFNGYVFQNRWRKQGWGIPSNIVLPQKLLKTEVLRLQAGKVSQNIGCHFLRYSLIENIEILDFNHRHRRKKNAIFPQSPHKNKRSHIFMSQSTMEFAIAQNHARLEARRWEYPIRDSGNC
jgi:hypothetical protein